MALNQPNRSIITCPECGHGLVKIGSKVERIHAIPRFITRHHTLINIVWVFVSPFALFLCIRGTGYTTRTVGLAWGAFLFAPSLIMYFLVRVFNLYRITDCPYCGFHEEVKLGRDTTP